MTPDDVRAAYRRQLDRHGEPATLQRLGPPSDGVPTVTVSAAVTMRFLAATAAEATPENPEQRGGAVVMHDDLVAASFPVPPRPGDRVKVGSRTVEIDAVAAASRRVAGVQIAYDLYWAGDAIGGA